MVEGTKAAGRTASCQASVRALLFSSFSPFHWVQDPSSWDGAPPPVISAQLTQPRNALTDIYTCLLSDSRARQVDRITAVTTIFLQWCYNFFILFLHTQTHPMSSSKQISSFPMGPKKCRPRLTSSLNFLLSYAYKIPL